MTAAQMRGLADMARELGDGDIRLTVGRTCCSRGSRRRTPSWSSAGCRDRADRPRPPASAPASSPARATPGASSPCRTPRARRWRSPNGSSRASPSTTPINIHLTGCPHSCAQHYIGDIGLLAAASPRPDSEDTVDGFHVFIGGGFGPGRGDRPRDLSRRAAERLPGADREDAAGLSRASCRRGGDLPAVRTSHEVDALRSLIDAEGGAA
jgi:ferredoxin-nitrite reductase